MQHPPSSFPMYTTSGSFHSFPGPNTNASGSTLRPHLHDSHMRHVAHNQPMGSTGLGGPPQSTTNMMTMPKFERPSSVNDPSRVQGGATSHFQNSSSLPLNSAPGQGSSVSHVKQESVDQSFEKNNAASMTSNEDLEKESSRMVLSTPNNMAPASSVSPSMTTQLDASTTVRDLLIYSFLIIKVSLHCSCLPLLFELLGQLWRFKSPCIFSVLCPTTWTSIVFPCFGFYNFYYKQ